MRQTTGTRKSPGEKIVKAINMTERGETSGVRKNQTEAGREYLQGNPDGPEKNNLDNLPEK